MRRARRAGGEPVVAGYAVEPLPDGVVTPALNAVNVHDAAALAAAIKTALQKVVAAAAPRRAGAARHGRQGLADPVREGAGARSQDLDQLIRWQIRKAAPFRIEDAQVAWFAGSAGRGRRPRVRRHAGAPRRHRELRARLRRGRRPRRAGRHRELQPGQRAARARRRHAVAATGCWCTSRSDYVDAGGRARPGSGVLPQPRPSAPRQTSPTWSIRRRCTTRIGSAAAGSRASCSPARRSRARIRPSGCAAASRSVSAAASSCWTSAAPRRCAIASARDAELLDALAAPVGVLRARSARRRKGAGGVMLRTNLSTRPFYNERARPHRARRRRRPGAGGHAAERRPGDQAVDRRTRACPRACATTGSAADDYSRKAAPDPSEDRSKELKVVVAAASEANALIDSRTFSWTAVLQLHRSDDAAGRDADVGAAGGRARRHARSRWWSWRGAAWTSTSSSRSSRPPARSNAASTGRSGRTTTARRFRVDRDLVHAGERRAGRSAEAAGARQAARPARPPAGRGRRDDAHAAHLHREAAVHLSAARRDHRQRGALRRGRLSAVAARRERRAERAGGGERARRGARRLRERARDDRTARIRPTSS